MESKQENRGLNLVIVHKETRWKKMKGRISSWFRSEKPVVDPVVVPEIIVTSPEDNTDVLKKSRVSSNVESEPVSAPVRLRKSGQEELARAHQDVIAQMRRSMAEARGGDTRGEINSTVKEKVALPEKPPVPPTKATERPPVPPGRAIEKPPVPPTKAVAVAKIREAIAQAKRESCQDLSTETSNTEADPEISAHQDKMEQDMKESLAAATTAEESQGITKKESGSAVAGSARDKLRAAIFSSTRTDTQETQCEHPSTSPTQESEAEKAERKAAVRAKIRAALLSAAAGQVEGSLQGPKQSTGKADPRRLSTPSTNVMLGGGLGPVTGGCSTPGGGMKDTAKEGRRRSASGIPQEKPKETIWEFFEEGKKKGTCKTCGYVVGIKHNKGGLTRHLSLVHQREYKEYTARMDKNWTHGMIERNLNMRVPKNI